jgi:tyrosyl-tRNA synthetase
VDPTAPDIHLGHSIALSKLRDFQDAGHDAILIIGDFTAMIGDPSGRAVTRPQLTHDQVMSNAKSFQEQAFKILDRARAKIVFNGEWFEGMSFEEVIKLNSRVTLQQMLVREDFRDRLDKGIPIRAHEIQYPIMQGWDSVMIKADVELGGTDQLFNIMVGRDLQREEGLPQQVAMVMPILEGLDGHQKMSKSLCNYIALTDAPGDMFGKIMSISDELMLRYYDVLLHEVPPSGMHPMEAKKALARRITSRYHGEEAGGKALEDFNTRFSARDLDSADLPVFVPAGPRDFPSLVVEAFATCFQSTRSRSDARRLIEGGSVQWMGEKITDLKAQLPSGSVGVLKLDKTRAVRVKA